MNRRRDYCLFCLILSLFGSLFLASRAIAPIEKAWKQQKDFLADASHELRTPLAVIKTNLEVILDSQQETVASQSEWLNNIKEESESMAKLVESLLFLAQADSKQQSIERDIFSLEQTIINAAKPFQPLVFAKKVNLEILVGDSIAFYGDEARIQQLTAILLDNALKAVAEGEEISIQLNKQGKEAVLVVADTGCGIGPEYLEKIFHRFYQVDKSRSSRGEGLGLAIAKWIVQSHGGTIKVNSTPNIGTEFRVHLPLAQS